MLTKLLPLKVSLLFVLLNSFAQCAEVSTTYLVFTGSFPATLDLVDIPQGAKQVGYDNLTEKGKQASGQPCYVTRIGFAKNSAYAEITITTTTHAESVLIQNMINQGRMVKLKSVEVVTEWDERRGGYITRAKRVHFNPYPKDYNQ